MSAVAAAAAAGRVVEAVQPDDLDDGRNEEKGPKDQMREEGRGEERKGEIRGGTARDQVIVST